MTPRNPFAIAALCIAALLGFAANSLLCRAALGSHAIDAATFTAIRLASGAAVLALLARRAPARAGNWISAAALAGYAAAFSFAYLRLTAATGALVLFAAVQTTMVGWGVWRGERLRSIEWIGFAIAAAGVVVLALPGLAAPDPLGAALMAGAGLCWGIYSLRGRGAGDPLAVTADNFARTLPLAAVLAAGGVVDGYANADGALLAIASGALASGIGYSLWYAVLPHLAATRAAIVQLSVPALTAAAAVAVLGETMTTRFSIAAVAILGGIALAVIARRR